MATQPLSGTNRITVATDLLIATVTAAIAVVTPIPLAILVILAFVVAMYVVTRLRMRAGRKITSSLLATAVFFSIVAGAALYTPTKRVHQYLNRPVQLPSASMTLADIAYMANFERELLPIRTSISFSEEEKNQRITWTERNITLGEFLDGIESQTSLRRRFLHCGTCSSILTGGCCSFGLMIREPNRNTFQSSHDQFDVDAYADQRWVKSNPSPSSNEQLTNQISPPPSHHLSDPTTQTMNSVK